jgi:hypothetical protein
MQRMTKQDGIAIAGSAAKLARLLGVSRAAVTQWGDWMPPYRAFQLREKMPDKYDQHCKEQKTDV